MPSGSLSRLSKSRYLRHSGQCATSVKVGLGLTSGSINLYFGQLHKHSRSDIKSYLARAYCRERLVYLRTSVNHSGNGIDPVKPIPVLDFVMRNWSLVAGLELDPIDFVGRARS